MKKNDTGAPPPNLKAVPSYREPFPPPKPQQVFVGPYFPSRDEKASCRACQGQVVTVSSCAGCENWTKLRAVDSAQAKKGHSITLPAFTAHLHVRCHTCDAISLFATRQLAKIREDLSVEFWQKHRAHKYRLIAVTVGLNALMFGAGYLGYLWWLR